MALHVTHETLRMSRFIEASVPEVWQANADTSVRSQWAVPAGEGLVYQFDDFRTGGRATYLCGPADNPQFYANVEYLLVKRLNVVVYVETLRSQEQLLSTGILTWRFDEAPNGMNVMVTNQLTSFVGHDMFDGNRNGHRIALEQLATLLAS